jgi:hypothetical protein
MLDRFADGARAFHSGRDASPARHDRPAAAAAAHPCHSNHVLPLIAADHMRGHAKQNVGHAHHPRAHGVFFGMSVCCGRFVW